jgi:hypothetical protein
MQIRVVSKNPHVAEFMGNNGPEIFLIEPRQERGFKQHVESCAPAADRLDGNDAVVSGHNRHPDVLIDFQPFPELSDYVLDSIGVALGAMPAAG